MAHWDCGAKEKRNTHDRFPAPSLQSYQPITLMYSREVIYCNTKLLPNIINTQFHTDNLRKFPSSRNCSFAFYLPVCYLNHANLTFKVIIFPPGSCMGVSVREHGAVGSLLTQREKVVGGWRKLYFKEPNYLQCSADNVRVVKFRGTGRSAMHGRENVHK